MAKLIEQKTYALVLDQNEINILYRVLIDSAYIDEELVYNMADTVVDGIDNLQCDDESLQSEDEDVDEEMPF